MKNDTKVFTAADALADSFNLVYKPIKKVILRNASLVKMLESNCFDVDDILNTAYIDTVDALRGFDPARPVNCAFVVEIARLKLLHRLQTLTRNKVSEKCRQFHAALYSAARLSDKTADDCELAEVIADEADVVSCFYDDAITAAVNESKVPAPFVTMVVDYIQRRGTADDIARRAGIDVRLLYIELQRFRRYMRARYNRAEFVEKFL